MDDFKKATFKDYTAWDLNCQWVIVRNRQKLEKIFKRKARRKNKRELDKIRKEGCENE